MSEWARKRFWTEATVNPVDGGFAILLDGRGVKTPAKAPLIVPTQAMADFVAAEWAAQGEKIDPETMPATRAANAAIDKVRPQFDAVADMIAAYGETDLLCYRADAPQALVQRQAAAWDPLLAWAQQVWGVEWAVTTGVMPTPQSPATVARLRAHIGGLTPFQMTAFHDLVAMSGSLVIGLAATQNQETPERLWDMSRIDEAWQIEQWGADDEATAQAEHKRQAFLNAARFFHACTDCAASAGD